MRLQTPVASVLLAGLLVGCSADDPLMRTKGGAAIGAVSGAVIGAMAGDRKTALIGAAVGAVAGGAVGNYMDTQQADAVGNYLVAGGVPQGRTRTEGRGEREPRATNATAAGKQLNRRVEIYVKPVVEGQEQKAWQPPA